MVGGPVWGPAPVGVLLGPAFAHRHARVDLQRQRSEQAVLVLDQPLGEAASQGKGADPEQGPRGRSDRQQEPGRFVQWRGGNRGELGDREGRIRAILQRRELAHPRPDCFGSGPLLVGDRFELRFPPLDRGSHQRAQDLLADLQRSFGIRARDRGGELRVVRVGGDVDHVRALFGSDRDRVLDLSGIDLVVEALRGALGDLWGLDHAGDGRDRAGRVAGGGPDDRQADKGLVVGGQRRYQNLRLRFVVRGEELEEDRAGGHRDERSRRDQAPVEPNCAQVRDQRGDRLVIEVALGAGHGVRPAAVLEHHAVHRSEVEADRAAIVPMIGDSASRIQRTRS